MRVTYKGHTYQYNHEDLTLEEGDKLETQAGIGYLEFASPDLKKFRTWRAIVWLCRMRDGEFDLRYEDVNAKFADVSFTADPKPDEDDDVPKAAATRKGNGAGPKTGTPKQSALSAAAGVTDLR